MEFFIGRWNVFWGTQYSNGKCSKTQGCILCFVPFLQLNYFSIKIYRHPLVFIVSQVGIPAYPPQGDREINGQYIAGIFPAYFRQVGNILLFLSRFAADPGQENISKQQPLFPVHSVKLKI